MIKEGLCVFSGHEVPKGSGLIRVTKDSKALLFKNRKVRALSGRKANPRAVKWTQASRIFYKKGSKSVVQKETKLRVVKEVRGFPMVPKSIISKEAAPKAESTGKGTGDFVRKEKVRKADKRKQTRSEGKKFR